ncbi:MAG TPA: hypothetical protein PKM20_07360 [Nitrosomonas sp.]|nr:hypothetical protein [Nitrosomonas sp.]
MLNHSRIDLLAKVRIVIYLQSTILQSIGGRTVSINKSKRSANNMLSHDFSTKTESILLSRNARLFKSLALAALLFACNQAMPSVIDDIKADMLLNEAKLLKAPEHTGWSKKANIDMGAAARGDATPFWWTPHDEHYKSSVYWNAITPWFVIYPGETHKAKNVRVKISGIKLFILERSTNNWRILNIDQTEPTWEFHQRHVTPSTAWKPVDKRVEPDGKISYKLHAGLNPIHGGTPKFDIDGSDVKAVYAQLTTELILDDPAGKDDRANAQILVSVGADYYPTMEHRVADFAAPHSWFPSVAASRFGLVKKLPRVHHMATIDPPGPIKNNGSAYPDKNKIISITEFEANPPPILISNFLSFIECN